MKELGSVRRSILNAVSGRRRNNGFNIATVAVSLLVVSLTSCIQPAAPAPAQQRRTPPPWDAPGMRFPTFRPGMERQPLSLDTGSQTVQLRIVTARRSRCLHTWVSTKPGAVQADVHTHDASPLVASCGWKARLPIPSRWGSCSRCGGCASTAPASAPRAAASRSPWMATGSSRIPPRCGWRAFAGSRSPLPAEARAADSRAARTGCPQADNPSCAEAGSGTVPGMSDLHELGTRAAGRTAR